MSQVDAVRRKLMASLHRRAIDDAVQHHGFDPELIADVLALCGGRLAEVSRLWSLFNRQPEQAGRTKFLLADFVKFIQERQRDPVLRAEGDELLAQAEIPKERKR